MADDLARFGVAMDRGLLAELDALVAARGGTRSEVLRNLVRGEVARARVSERVGAVATLTLVYDHHVRELTEHITEFQHQLGEQVRATLHVHLDERRCLEVVVMRGWSDNLKRAAERLLATRGVTHGGLEMVAEESEKEPRPRHRHAQDHDHEREHGARRGATVRRGR